MKDGLVFQYKKLKSGKYGMYRLFVTSSGDIDGDKIGETWNFSEVMDKKNELKRVAERAGYKFQSRRV